MTTPKRLALRVRRAAGSAAPAVLALVLLGHTIKHFGVELFCGITPFRARPTRETLRGINRGPGERRGAPRPAHPLAELLQGIVVAR